MFDPYLQWLDIPADRRPPTSCQLLGIADQENKPKVIAEAATRRTKHLLNFRTSANAPDCARLLGEIVEARALLFKRYGTPEKDAPPAPAPAVKEKPAPLARPHLTAPEAPTTTSVLPKQRRLWQVAGGVLVLLLLVGGMATLLHDPQLPSRPSESVAVAVNPTEKGPVEIAKTPGDPVTPKFFPEAKPEPKLEPKVEPKPEPKTEPKPDPAVDVAELIQRALDDKEKDKNARIAAIRKLAAIGKTPQIVAGLLQALQDSDADVSAVAGQALAQLRPLTQAHVPALRATLKSKHMNARNFALQALGEVGSEAKEAVPDLLQTALNDSDEKVRLSAADALGKTGPAAKAVVPQIMKFFKDRDDEGRRRALLALKEIGRIDKDAIAEVDAYYKENKNRYFKVGSGMERKHFEAALLAAEVLAANAHDPKVEDAGYFLLKRGIELAPDEEVRKRACAALGKLGPDTHADVQKRLVPGLGNKETRDPVAQALLRMKENAVRVLYWEGLTVGGGNAAIRIESARLLGEIGPYAKEAIPTLIEKLGDQAKSKEPSELAEQSCLALKKIGKAAVPRLREAVKNPKKTEQLRFLAARALGEIGPEAKDAAPDLVKLLGEKVNGETSKVADEARVALSRIGKDTVTDLREALNDKDPQVIILAARALGEIGPDAKDAVQQLTALAQNQKQPKIQKECETALKKIQGKN